MTRDEEEAVVNPRRSRRSRTTCRASALARSRSICPIASATKRPREGAGACQLPEGQEKSTPPCHERPRAGALPLRAISCERLDPRKPVWWRVVDADPRSTCPGRRARRRDEALALARKDDGDDDADALECRALPHASGSDGCAPAASRLVASVATEPAWDDVVDGGEDAAPRRRASSRGVEATAPLAVGPSSLAAWLKISVAARALDLRRTSATRTTATTRTKRSTSDVWWGIFRSGIYTRRRETMAPCTLVYGCNYVLTTNLAPPLGSRARDGSLGRFSRTDLRDAHQSVSRVKVWVSTRFQARGLDLGEEFLRGELGSLPRAERVGVELDDHLEVLAPTAHDALDGLHARDSLDLHGGVVSERVGEGNTPRASRPSATRPRRG